jgi:hypothetical protein
MRHMAPRRLYRRHQLGLLLRCKPWRVREQPLVRAAQAAPLIAGSVVGVGGR